MGCSTSKELILLQNQKILDDFHAFISEHCVQEKGAWTPVDVLQSAWVSYKANHRVYAQRLCLESGYKISGNMGTPVVVGLRIVDWPV